MSFIDKMKESGEDIKEAFQDGAHDLADEAGDLKDAAAEKAADREGRRRLKECCRRRRFETPPPMPPLRPRTPPPTPPKGQGCGRYRQGRLPMPPMPPRTRLTTPKAAGRTSNAPDAPGRSVRGAWMKEESPLVGNPRAAGFSVLLA